MFPSLAVSVKFLTPDSGVNVLTPLICQTLDAISQVLGFWEERAPDRPRALARCPQRPVVRRRGTNWPADDQHASTRRWLPAWAIEGPGEDHSLPPLGRGALRAAPRVSSKNRILFSAARELVNLLTALVSVKFLTAECRQIADSKGLQADFAWHQPFWPETDPDPPPAVARPADQPDSPPRTAAARGTPLCPAPVAAHPASKAVWDEFAGRLSATGVLTGDDQAALAAFATSYSDYLSFLETWEVSGRRPVVVIEEPGRVGHAPAADCREPADPGDPRPGAAGAGPGRRARTQSRESVEGAGLGPRCERRGGRVRRL